MSFILDALKKAESERSRASGPVLVDVRIAPPRRRLPAWAWVLGAVLVANLALLSWLVLRTPPAVVAGQAAAPVPAAAQGAATNGGVQRVPSPVPMPGPVAPAAPAAMQAAPYVTPEPSLPLVDPARSTTPTAPPVVKPVPRSGGALLTAKQLQATGVSLPPLLLNLHVYDPSPSLRYVLMNGLRLAEGEFTPDGIKVDTITEDGVVLEARGHRFVLPAGAE
jgi:general secretion pathway protein B